MMESWMGKWSIKAKMMVGFLSVSLISLLMLYVFSNYTYTPAVEKGFFTTSSQAAFNLNHHLDFYFEQMAQSTESLIKIDPLQDWLEHSRPFTSLDIQGIRDEMFGQVALNHHEIVGMYLESTERDVLSLYDTADYTARFAQTPWYARPLSPKLEVIPSYHTNNSQAGRKPVIALAIPIFSKLTLQQIGRLVIEMTLDELDDTIGKTGLGRTGIFFAVAPDGTIAYHPESDLIGQKLSATKLAKLDLSQSDEALVQKWNNRKMLLAYNVSELTGWKIVAFVPFDEMAGVLHAARVSTVIAFAAITALILVTVPLLSHRFVKPIRRLKELMVQVSLGRLDVRAEAIPGHDEFQQLGRSFNVMVGRLAELVHTVKDLNLKEVHLRLRQKEALVQALQNQINPHLLYNSLDIIKSIAYLEGSERIEKLARNLADVYRYTASIATAEVSLDEELRHLEKYLQIVHTRFPRHFQSRIYVNEKFRACRVVKLTLQPIVENAVKYAIEPSGGDGSIIVNAYDDKDALVIEIADNGPGMDAETVRRLNLELERITATIDQEYVQQASLGLSNVHARLLLTYGKEYGLSAVSFPERGTVVSVRVPL